MFLKTVYTDEELIKACADNDRRAQEVLFKKYFDTVFINTNKYIKDESTSMDIVNSAFLKVFQNIHKFEIKGSLEGWIRRIVYNTMIDQIRYNKRKFRFLVLEDYNEDTIHRDHDVFEQEDLMRIVDKLPSASKQVFKYYAIEGYNHAEIASMLNISEGTSKWHLSVAREKLRNLLNENKDFLEYGK